jgi:AbrB family looped-hinge helix DNA binding protein
MLMKVFNKGQVVIPSEIRKGLGIVPGDFVEVTFDLPNKKIEMRPHGANNASSIAGAFVKYARRKPFPAKQKMASLLRESLSHGS